MAPASAEPGTLRFPSALSIQPSLRGRGAPPTGGAGPAEIGAADPVGGVSFFDAVEKQLGLKLEARKRMYPVFVIDHMDDKPSDN